MAQPAVRMPREVRRVRAIFVRVLICRGVIMRTGMMAQVRSVRASRPDIQGSDESAGFLVKKEKVCGNLEQHSPKPT